MPNPTKRTAEIVISSKVSIGNNLNKIQDLKLEKLAPLLINRDKERI